MLDAKNDSKASFREHHPLQRPGVSLRQHTRSQPKGWSWKTLYSLALSAALLSSYAQAKPPCKSSWSLSLSLKYSVFFAWDELVPRVVDKQ